MGINQTDITILEEKIACRAIEKFENMKIYFTLVEIMGSCSYAI